jgi:hypothetical protein
MEQPSPQKNHNHFYKPKLVYAPVSRISESFYASPL